jgi:hypothetical protein
MALNSTDDLKIKANKVLKDYVNQMRVAGFPTNIIKEKLLKEGRVFVPNQLPEGFGQVWSAGLADELKSSAEKKGGFSLENMIDIMPSPSNYLEYMPGYTVNRLPEYNEYYDYIKGIQPSGKFGQTKMANIMNAFQNILNQYQGPKVGWSEYAAESGLYGLPQSLAAKWYPQFVSLAQQKAEQSRQQQEYEDLIFTYPELEKQFKPGMTANQYASIISANIEKQNKQKLEEESQQAEFNTAIKEAQNLIDDWITAKSEGGNLFGTIIITEKNEKGEEEEKEKDIFDLIIYYIREGQNINKVKEFIDAYNIPINNYELKGLYIYYGQQNQY